MAQQLSDGCTGKTRWEREEDAIREERSGRGKRRYRCPRCGFWHVGGRNKGHRRSRFVSKGRSGVPTADVWAELAQAQAR